MARDCDARPSAKPKAYSKNFRRLRLPVLTDDDRELLTVRPRTRGDCDAVERPCVHVTCRHNLWLDVSNAGSIKFNHPNVEPDEMAAQWSCALDVASRGPLGLTQIGRAMNVVRERVRQIEKKALEKLSKRAREIEDMNKYKITIRQDAGSARSNGKPAPIVASRGRVFFVYAMSGDEARERFRGRGIPAFSKTPAVPKLFDDDFDVALSTADDEKTVVVENWTKSKP